MKWPVGLPYRKWVVGDVGLQTETYYKMDQTHWKPPLLRLKPKLVSQYGHIKYHSRASKEEKEGKRRGKERVREKRGILRETVCSELME